VEVRANRSQNLVTCARDGGNYLLNIGPDADGGVPKEASRILGEVGRWLEVNGRAIFGTERGNLGHGSYGGLHGARHDTVRACLSVAGHTPAERWLPFYQPGVVLAFGGLNTKVKSVRLLATGTPVAFEQDALALRLKNLPQGAPDSPLTVFEVECESVPTLNHQAARDYWTRYGVGIS